MLGFLVCTFMLDRQHYIYKHTMAWDRNYILSKLKNRNRFASQKHVNFCIMIHMIFILHILLPNEYSIAITCIHSRSQLFWKNTSAFWIILTHCVCYALVICSRTVGGNAEKEGSYTYCLLLKCVLMHFHGSNSSNC